jgi:YbbR domain-containing protein
MEITKKLKLPEGVKLYTPVKDVTVSVTIEQYSNKDITVSSKDIALFNKQTDNLLNYNITTSSVIINLKGFKSDINTLDVPTIKPYIDVKGLGPGEYKLPLKAALPSDVYFLQDYMIDLKIEAR